MKNVDTKRIKALQYFYSKQKRLPSYAEMLDLFGLHSKNAIHRLVQRLVAGGILKKDTTGRYLPGRAFIALPLLGYVQAGWPSPAEEELNDTISLDDYLIRNRTASFLLKISGDSMVEAGIMSGDLIVVERGRSAKVGDIVVAQVDNDWTVKRLEKRAGQYVLVPANRKYRTIQPLAELTITDVVAGVIRRYG